MAGGGTCSGVQGARGEAGRCWPPHWYWSDPYCRIAKCCSEIAYARPAARCGSPHPICCYAVGLRTGERPVLSYSVCCTVIAYAATHVLYCDTAHAATHCLYCHIAYAARKVSYGEVVLVDVTDDGRLPD
eukprot:1950687-Rhodomonas_salina.1